MLRMYYGEKRRRHTNYNGFFYVTSDDLSSSMEVLPEQAFVSEYFVFSYERVLHIYSKFA